MIRKGMFINSALSFGGLPMALTMVKEIMENVKTALACLCLFITITTEVKNSIPNRR